MAGCISAGALALAEEAVVGMVAIKGKVILMVLAFGLAIGGASWSWVQRVGREVQTGSTASGRCKRGRGAFPRRKSQRLPPTDTVIRCRSGR